ncbi:sensitivity to high expression protein she9 [Didymella heteroderae]|uniref:Sensitive to high expression protein 9, mitochondrial n=1 Tax=Didymella heteroderae TaxID=1769908 RepID=A0A9P4WVK2_9PLEO|nr:sensitivity to high expression protein she9 [Didymella heteroderae]
MGQPVGRSLGTNARHAWRDRIELRRQPATSMRPLLQHASRLPKVNAATITPSNRTIGRFIAQSPSICVNCQCRRASTAIRRSDARNASRRWLQRQFSSSSKWLEDRKPLGSSDPIAMPPLATEHKPKPASPVDRTPEDLIARQERLRREWEEQQRKREEEALRKKQQEEEARRKREEEEALRKKREAEALQRKQEEEAVRKRHDQEALRKSQQTSQSAPAPVQPRVPTPESVPEQPSPVETQRPILEPAASRDKQDVVDNVKRVPDEQLPSHQERQRSNFEKRFTALMDELLPKIAVVTQKVNTYTGTDYSGVEALRREIEEQEKLVKARRLAIDSTKEALDAALEQQAASQKEVVALLERKHSWSSSDLERYMSLIRSEHLNDKAVREAKEAVEAAETALEEARSYLEKRERAQYHEEQIWSDTIRRNSTWVTFGLMGVNIFLLLLSLLILEPWRRRRMVREIKSALEAQQATAEAAVVPPLATPYAMANPVTEPTVTTPAATTVPAQKATEPEAAVVKTAEPAPKAALAPSPVAAEPSTDESPTAGTVDPLRITDEHGYEIGNVIDEVPEPTVDPLVPGAAALMSKDAEASPQETVDIQKEAWESMSTTQKIEVKLGLWRSKAAVVAEDIVSDRPISMRRVDFTTAILQGAAAGAVIAAASIALLLRPN